MDLSGCFQNSGYFCEVGELNALKDQNRELVHCLESLEGSRKQYETDARRYRNQYEKSEQESETLRFKIGDIEKKLGRDACTAKGSQ